MIYDQPPPLISQLDFKQTSVQIWAFAEMLEAHLKIAIFFASDNFWLKR